jgi:hypothetical protein
VLNVAQEAFDFESAVVFQFQHLLRSAQLVDTSFPQVLGYWDFAMVVDTSRNFDLAVGVFLRKLNHVGTLV